MPLQRKLGSSRSGIWGVEFVMVTRDGTPVPCNVTRDALTMLFGSGGIAAVGQLACSTNVGIRLKPSPAKSGIEPAGRRQGYCETRRPREGGVR